MTDIYNYQPNTRDELREIIKNRLEKDLNANLNDIDVSQITDMSMLFKDLDPHNINISTWDVSNVSDMSKMFQDCQHFTGASIENWDVSGVYNMNQMFYQCDNFNCDLGNWNTGKVEDMREMFYGCGNFKGNGLENWDMKNVMYADRMFDFCYIFDCDVSKWNTSKFEEIAGMFFNCKKFKGVGLEKWNTQNVTNMHGTFGNCKIMDADFSNWDVRKVMDMIAMFIGCEKFKGKGLENWKLKALGTGLLNTFKGCKMIKRPAWYGGII